MGTQAAGRLRPFDGARIAGQVAALSAMEDILMMRTMTGAAAALLALAGAAEARPSTTAMTCGQAQTFLRKEGAAVIGTGGQTYDRFVADRSFCQQTEVTKRAFVATRDTRACLIGYTCREPSRDDWIGDNF